MPAFAYPFFLWALALVAVPVLIHLINLFRRRRVSWAAMEFLLASRRRNQRRILLKQWLLLLMRMAAVALLVLVVARPYASSWWSALGRGQTHIIVLLDDSYSMEDTDAAGNSWRRATGAVESLVRSVHSNAEAVLVSVLRFSQAAGADTANPADFFRQPVGTELLQRLPARLDELQPTARADGPLPALELAAEWTEDLGNERTVVYVISDFRRRDWEEGAQTLEPLEQLADRNVSVRFLRTVQEENANLTLRSVRPLRRDVAVDVPLELAVEVENRGATAARRVSVHLKTDEAVLPTLEIEEVAPRSSAVERVTVSFATAGQHTVTAQLEEDAIPPDNVRYAVVDVPQEMSVLLVDGDPQSRSARYAAAAFAPGAAVRTGIRPQIEPPRFLAQNALDAFDSIFLFDVGQLAPTAVTALEDYLRDGGGVCFFLGERVDTAFYNQQLYRDGDGLFPAALSAPREMAPDRLRAAPDVSVTGHPVFRIFQGQQNSFLNAILVSRYFTLDEQRRKPTAETIARLRNGHPLALEVPYERGKVVVFLTTAAPIWNNWARGNPSFVVTLLELHGYLRRLPEATESATVGEAIRFDYRSDRYQPALRWQPPPETGLPPETLSVEAGEQPQVTVQLPAAELPGVYTLRLIDRDGTSAEKRFAVNVDPSEGDVRLLTQERFSSRYGDLVDAFTPAELSAGQTLEQLAGSPDRMLLYLLMLLVIGEQAVARWTSYHPKDRVAAAGGARR